MNGLGRYISTMHKLSNRILIRHSRPGAGSIDYYACISRLRQWNSGFKMLFAFNILLACIVFDNLWVSLTVITSMGLLTVLGGGIPLKKYLRLFTIPFVFMVMSSLAIAAQFGTKPLGEWSINLRILYISTGQEEIKMAFHIFFKALGAVSAMYMMTLSTPVGEIISVLHRIHIPDLVIELMYLIYRFIFILTDAQKKMDDAAKSRLGYVDYKTSLQTFGRIGGNLLFISLKKSGAYYDAMEARCYEGKMNFLEEEKPVKSWQIGGAVCFYCILAAIGLFT